MDIDGQAAAFREPNGLIERHDRYPSHDQSHSNIPDIRT